ncbi:hypothetical protein EYB45_08940 [Erythrobacteraceae bacterium CFH 75059]|uniref:hypothetical protein n=1 Tax=Qipengyuania thermophila TaxID=2509361 RepID=UPI0010213F61|nr:hypothetical protein [Qipengyuania thermophila]TCD04350.1 hypothetical protein EYB45_08940 [Erythrobacteraceae bacterium CFH 75059]
MTGANLFRQVSLVGVMASLASSCIADQKNKGMCANEFSIQKEGYFEVDLALLLPSDLRSENAIFFSLRCNEALTKVIVSDDTVVNIRDNEKIRKYKHVSGNNIVLASFEVYSNSSEKESSAFVMRVNRNVSVEHFPDWIGIKR